MARRPRSQPRDPAGAPAVERPAAALSYYLKVLREGEKVHFIGHVHWLVYLRGFAVMCLALLLIIAALALAATDLRPAYVDVVWAFALVVAALGSLSLLRAALRRRTTEIVVTDLRVIYKRGLISRHTVEMNTSKIETVDVEQSLVGRLCGYGTVLIRGTGAGFEPLRNVAAPVSLRNAILVG